MKRLSDRQFGLFFGVACAAFGVALHIFFDVAYFWFVVFGAALAAIAMIYPMLLLPLNRAWMAFAIRLGVANSYLILGLIYFCIFAPVRLLMRLIAKDPMQREYDLAAESYFRSLERATSSETYRDQF